MSGIVGIVRRDGAPVEQDLLRELTGFLSFRGPDGTGVWLDGSAGFGHALLQTNRDIIDTAQPAGLAGRFWIAADARIDCRKELESALGAAGDEDGIAASDPLLILRAYAKWGEDCVQHLSGDFAFAIWDAAERSLFCARDHFGIKPFYFAQRDDVLVFSNTLNCLRLHPSVSDHLNEAAVADFLIWGLNCDLATTTFRDIRRLPPGHFLSLSSAGVRVQRYWSPPTNRRICYSRAADYVEHFQSIFKAAVADRLHTDCAGILLSGGLDSGAVAAAARAGSTGQSTALRAYTVTYDSLMPDRESFYAKETADFLHIPIRFFPFDNALAFDRWDDPHFRRPEPDESPFFAAEMNMFEKIGADCRVALSGEGNDNLMLFEMWPYMRQLWRERRWARLLRDGAHYLWVRPFPWRGLRHRLKRFLRRPAPVVPSWIDPDFARRLNLEERRRAFADRLPKASHDVLPKAHASLALPQWAHVFENDDPGVTRSTVEIRYPFLDLRIVNYLLALPPFPSFFEKRLLREAMSGQLPENVRRRRKTALPRDPLAELLKKAEAASLVRNGWDKNIARFIDVSRLRSLAQNESAAEIALTIRPYCLNFWLQSATPVRYKLVGAEARNG